MRHLGNVILVYGHHQWTRIIGNIDFMAPKNSQQTYIWLEKSWVAQATDINSIYVLYTLALKQIPLPAQHIPVAWPNQSTTRWLLIHLDTSASLDRSDQVSKFFRLYLYGHHGLHNLLLSIPSEGAHATILRMIRQSNKCANTAHDGYVQNAGGYTLSLQSRKQFQKHRLYIGLAWNNEFAHGPCICTSSLKKSLFKTDSNAESALKET